MTRKIKIFILAVSIGFLSFMGKVYGFCIYNQTDKVMYVKQVSGGRFLKSFYAELMPGQHACCNWKNRDCNKEGKRDSIVRFNVYYKVTSKDGRRLIDKEVCHRCPIPAGGWIEIRGKYGQLYHCVTHE